MKIIGKNQNKLIIISLHLQKIVTMNTAENQLKILLEFGKAINKTKSLNSILESIEAFRRDILRADRCSIFVYDKKLMSFGPKLLTTLILFILAVIKVLKDTQLFQKILKASIEEPNIIKDFRIKLLIDDR